MSALTFKKSDEMMVKNPPQAKTITTYNGDLNSPLFITRSCKYIPYHKIMCDWMNKSSFAM